MHLTSTHLKVNLTLTLTHLKINLTLTLTLTHLKINLTLTLTHLKVNLTLTITLTITITLTLSVGIYAFNIYPVKAQPYPNHNPNLTLILSVDIYAFNIYPFKGQPYPNPNPNPFHWYICIQHLKVKVKIMHISTANILELVKDILNVTIAIRVEVMYDLSTLHLTLTHS